MRPHSRNPISVKEARKLLGKEGKLLNDDQIIELVDTLHLLAQYEISLIGSNNERK